MNSFPSIRVATEADTDALASLILEEYASAADFDIKNSSEIIYDTAALVFVATDSSGAIVSAMQATICHSHAEAESIIQCEIPAQNFASPVLVIARGATRDSHRRSGLSSLLYLQFIKLAIRQNCYMAISTIYESGPWVPHMNRLGFVVARPNREWQSHVTHKKQLLLSLLHKNQFGKYVDAETGELKIALESFPWFGPIPSMKAKQ